MATARAILATYLDFGIAFDAAPESLGQAAVEWGTVDVGWSDTLNQRRFALIDMPSEDSSRAFTVNCLRWIEIQATNRSVCALTLRALTIRIAVTV